ncbi:hypothetical protein HYDPIDRAFT_174910 [Hydnomerulius pinastri MD-312]|nr:hypothetical protein HYDPIDRAFT_174910 [Hydnomerulius pinastri MD-312]
MAETLPPLLGDGNGRYRVHIVGNSGSSQSTLGQKLAEILCVPYISLDRLFWGPGWVENGGGELRRRLNAALDDAEQKAGGWIVDGNYTRHLENLLERRQTDTIWLDPPLVLYFPRLVWRTVLRIMRLAPDCSEGCRESFVNAFLTRGGIVYLCLGNHAVARRKNQDLMLTNSLQAGGNMRRMGGWGGELSEWIKEVEELVRGR